MVKCTRTKNQATPKAAFGFLRDNEQICCVSSMKSAIARICEFKKQSQNVHMLQSSINQATPKAAFGLGSLAAHGTR